MAGGRDSVPKDHQQEMTYGVSSGHVLRGSTVDYPSDSLPSYQQLLLGHSMSNQSVVNGDVNDF